jgi:hypothetical protein
MSARVKILSIGAKMSGWSDLDDKPKGGLSGRFVKFSEEKSTRVRFLDEAPKTTFVHKVTGKDDTFRTIPATENLDDDYIQQSNGKRFPAVAQYSMRAFEFARDDKGNFTDSGEIKIVQGGPAIFKQLRTIMEESGSLRDYDIIISVKGKKRDTEYTVSASPVSKKINVDDLLVQMEADEALQWGNVLPTITAEQQKKILAEAKIDIFHDPVAEIAANMSLDQAKGTVLSFGKYKGKTVGDALVIDSSWVEWASENVTSNDSIAAACRVAFGGVQALAEAPAAPAQLKSPTPASAPAAKSAPAPKAAPANPEAAEKTALISSVSAKLEAFSAPKIVQTIKEASSTGETKLAKLTVDELKKLEASLS